HLGAKRPDLNPLRQPRSERKGADGELGGCRVKPEHFGHGGRLGIDEDVVPLIGGGAAVPVGTVAPADAVTGAGPLGRGGRAAGRRRDEEDALKEGKPLVHGYYLML